MSIRFSTFDWKYIHTANYRNDVTYVIFAFS